MDKQREEFEKAYAEICQPIVRRPYPISENGEYIYEEIHKAYLMWQQAQKMAVPDGFLVVPREPTEAMLQSGQDMVTFGCGYDDIYKAMIEAGEKK